MKILFIVQRTEVFNSVKTIFEDAVKDPRCEVYLLPLPRGVNTDNGQIVKMDTLRTVHNFCTELDGATVIDSYNEEKNSFYDLAQLAPDYIFLNVPYTNQYPAEYSIEKLAAVGKICFVPYGYTLGDINKYKSVYQTEFNTPLLMYASFLFLDGCASHKYCRRRMWLSELIDGRRRFNLGYPRFDRITPVKDRQQKFVALWIPRWTTNKQVGFFSSTFFDFKDVILDYFGRRADNCEVIVRPHPIAFDNYIKDGLMSAEDVAMYKSRYTGNLHLDESPDYLSSFAVSDILIADYSSIILEFFVTKKPIIYCGSQDDFDIDLRYVTDTFYYASNWHEVERFLNQLMRGEDIKKGIRIDAVNRFLSNSSCAGKKILSCLINDYKHEK